MVLDCRTRRRFDRVLEEVLAELPDRVHELLQEVPLHVEDHPPASVMRRMRVRRRDALCGLFTGIPLTADIPVRLPDFVTIYREGILAAAADRDGRVRRSRLRREIRVTILHELAHYHGLTEEELADLGYG